MTMFMIPMIIMLSILFTRMIHPLAMGLNLLIQTIIISFSAGLTTYSFWFSYILFLIFLGGMLILFIYVASLASNEIFLPSLILSFFSLILTVSLFLLFFFLDPIFISSFSNLPNSTVNIYSSTAHITSWIFNNPSMYFTIFIISYLLLTLLVVVKIINLYKGPLRLMN
uniref:NADH-ubiquinone oxidoreductase chain 6 n=1 Tax=Nanhaipotamon hongkongense TaxID=328652 RepID=A0A891GZ41_9EUCA|nr:NADH dehydrogenase subunit 6 [Nanhaipotamon hongkongense]QRK27355.1 NADH dehydrogenase subunit 6 [Nanhaipotamon hongkongense]